MNRPVLEASARARALRPTISRRFPPLHLVALFVCSAVFVAFLLLPLLALFIRVGQAEGALGYVFRPVVVDAVRLSLGTTLASIIICVVLGTPIAYLLARYSVPGSRIIDTLIDLPMVLPPAVAGMAMLMAFGRRGLLGSLLDEWGLEIAFTTGAVIMAQTFVAAPFYIRSARAGFEKVPVGLERVSATLGVSNWRGFWRITVPLALPSLASGTVMAWARALGEFGATIMFAGNFPGRSQTMPLAIYSALQSDLDAALVLSAIMLLLSFVILATLHFITRRGRVV